MSNTHPQSVMNTNGINPTYHTLSAPPNYGGYIGGGVPPTTTNIPTHNHQYNVQWPEPQQAINLPPMEGVDELAELLGVSPANEQDLTGIMVVGNSGVRYSFVNILRAQLELLTRLNILLVHRKLVPDE